MEEELNLYYTKRNMQIAEFKREGRSWQEIADLMCLSKGYVKEIGHKQGVHGPQRKFKPSTSKQAKNQIAMFK